MCLPRSHSLSRAILPPRAWFRWLARGVPILVALATSAAWAESARPDVMGARQPLDEAQRTAAGVLHDNLPGGTLGLRCRAADADRSWSAGAGFASRVWQPDAFVSRDCLEVF